MPSLDEVLSNATSDEVDIDFSEAKEFGAVPAGTYEAVIEEAKPGVTGPRSKTPGTPKIAWRFKVTEEGPAKGRVFFLHTALKGEQSGRAKEVLRVLGVDVSGPNIKFKTSQAVGQKVTIVVDKDDDPDSDWPNSVKRVKAPGSKPGVVSL